MASLLELGVSTGKWDAGLKKAKQSLDNFVSANGGLQQSLDKDSGKISQFVRMMGQMNSTAKTAKGQMNDYKSTLEQLTMQYNRLTDSQKKTVGQDYLASIEQIKQKYRAVSQEIDSFNRSLRGDATGSTSGKFGQFGGIVDDLGHKMGISANLTELLTSKTALLTTGMTAAAAAVGKATEEWVKYNKELAQQDQQTTVITGLKGNNANQMTDSMRAIVDTYKVDFRQAVDAANTLMVQFGLNGDQAIQLIREGMQGMIMGDGSKMLAMIQQFAPAFVDAGLSADKLVAIIHNSEGGLFTDQNMNAILMGIKNIRLMTNSTSEALAKLGIDGQEMSRKMSDGSMTVFEALRKVSEALESAKSGSQEAGQVMQYVFGRQGAMQGMKLARAIAELNLNLEETKKQTGEVGDAYDDLYNANQKLAVAIRECFGYDGYEAMATGIKTTLISALAAVIVKLGTIRSLLFDSIAGGVKRSAESGNEKVDSMISTLQGSNKKSETFSSGVSYFDTEIKRKQKELSQLSVTSPLSDQIRKINAELNTLKRQKQEYIQRASEIITGVTGKAETQPGKIDTTPKSTKTTTAKPQTETQELEAANAKLVEEYQNLATAAKTADETQKAGITERMTAIKQEIKINQDRIAELKKFADAAKSIDFKEGSLPALNKQLKELQENQSKAASTQEWQSYQKQIDETTRKVAILKGELPKGEQATFTMDVSKSQLDSLRNDGLFSNKSMRTKVEESETIEGNAGAEKRYTITIAADTTQAMQQVEQLVQGIEHDTPVIKPKVEMPTNIDTMKQQMQLEIEAENAKVDTATLETILKDSVKDNIDIGSLLDAEQLMINAGINVPDETWEEILEKYNELREQIGEEPIKIDFKSGKIAENGKEAEKAWQAASSAVQSVGSAFSQIEDPGVKAMGTVMQAIASIALGFAQASAQASSMGPWAWLAFVAAGMAATATTIATIHNLTHMAEGGIVQGNSYSGDNVGPVMLDAGEVVLNRAQTASLASVLTESENRGYGGSIPYVTGEKIVLGINNWAKRSGRGELVFSR